MLSAGLIVSACSKSNNESKPVLSCKVKSVESLFNADSQEKLFYTYDDKGKIVRIDHGTATSTNYETLAYQTDKIIVSSPSNGTVTYTLDASGRIISGDQFTFKYNTDGYLIEAKRTGTNDVLTLTFTYQNGNLTKFDNIHLVNGQSVDPSNTVIEYTTDASQDIAGSGNPIGNFSFSKGILASYFGKASKNLIAKDTFKSIGSADEVTSYTYQKDDKGNITSVKKASSQNYNQEVKVNYQCQ